jgi:subtilisin family serine protease
MRSKRLLTLLLVLCMVVSTLAPAAHAANWTKGGPVQSQDAAPTNPAAAEKAPAGALNLRDNPLTKEDAEETSEAKGQWNATRLEDSPASLTLTDTPACIEELRRAAAVIAADEVVSAFVVMEQAPLAELHSSIVRVPARDEQQLLSAQNVLIDKIQKDVLEGEKLTVRYQFTYLTNAFSIETEFVNLEQIASMPGVKSVFVMPVYHPAEVLPGTVTPSATASGEMVGVPSIWADLGYTGTGMKIAVLDTGLDLDHPSFAAAPVADTNSMTVEDIADVLEDLNAYKRMKGNVTAEDLYNTEKVPFVFNYSDSNLVGDHSQDNQGDHGTHVAGIAAANAKVEGTEVVGMAPDAQIIVMKVFGATRAGAADDLVAALEDAMLLGCDVANLSLGSTAGFSSADNELDLIYERIASQDIVVAIAGGNDNTSSYQNMWGTNQNPTAHPDNATINSPAIYANATAVASANNAKLINSCACRAKNEVRGVICGNVNAVCTLADLTRLIGYRPLLQGFKIGHLLIKNDRYVGVLLVENKGIQIEKIL